MIDETLSNEDYHAHDAIGSTQLRYFMQSPAKFKASMDGKLKPKQSKEFDVGTYAHEIMLEGKLPRFMSDEAIIPAAIAEWEAKNKGKQSKNIRGTKVYEDMVKQMEGEGKVILSTKNYQMLEDMHEAFFNHPKAAAAVNPAHGKPEVSFFTKWDGFEYKCRADFFGERKGKTYLVDYKTTSGGEFADIQRSLGKYGYDVQAAHYMDVVQDCVGKRPDVFIFIFQEKEPPYEVAVIRVGNDTLDYASQALLGVKEKIRNCFDADHFPTKYGEDTVTMEVNEYRQNELERWIHE